MAGFSMLSSIQNLTGRKSIRYTLLCIVIAGLAFIVLQIGSKYLLRQWLLENGADNVTIATMWLNPFSGKFSVNGVDIRRGDHVVYSNDIVHFNIGMFSLFEKDALIQQAILHDMMINIYRYESGKLQIGSYPLPLGSKEDAEEKRIFPPWTLKAKEVLASNITINYYQPGFKLKLKIDSAKAQRLDSGKDDNTGSLTLSGHLNDAPLDLEISRFLLEPFPILAGKLSLTGLSLEEFGKLLQQLNTVTGTASVAGPFSIQSSDDEKVTYTYNGKLEFNNTTVGNDSWTTSGNIGWNGIIQHKNLGNSKMETVVDGNLSAQSLYFQGNGMHLEAKSAEFLTDGNSRLQIDEAVTLFTDASLLLFGVAAGNEGGELGTTSASWHGTVEYGTGKNDGKSTIITNGGAIFEETNFIADTTHLRQPHFETAGKAEVIISDDLRILYNGVTSFSDTELNSGQYSFFGEKISYSGQTGYDAPSGNIAAVQMDGLLSTENLSLKQTDPELRWSQKQSEVNGDFKLLLGSAPLITGTAGLNMKSVRLLQKEQPAASLDELTIEQLKGDDQGNLSIPMINFGLLSLHSSPLLPLNFAIGSGQFEGITSKKMKNYAMDSILLESIVLPSAGSQQLDLRECKALKPESWRRTVLIDLTINCRFL
jgi:hypothetical protein